MGELIYAIIIGIIQGLTEFLPISSTAHMTIVAKLLGSKAFSDPKVWTATMATIQLGTLASLLYYFRKDLRSIGKSFLTERPSYAKVAVQVASPEAKLGWMIAIGSVPIFFFGYFLQEFIEGEFTKSLWTISISLVAVALIMLLAERIGKFSKSTNDITAFEAFLIGIAQALALIPGVSRSGATITTGLLLGMKRDEAAKFSFLLSIPAVFVSGLYEFIYHFELISKQNLTFLFVSLIFAFLSGVFAINFLLKFLKTKSTLVFIVYRIVLGLVIIAFLL
ncbi:MAG: undecaprenyl-diphosphatase UppP [Ignavibacteria bacterium]|nr:undecaprenyl-diphosphatase UppP [Ignavibacteria bacterium]